jgi:hypothetical protein
MSAPGLSPLEAALGRSLPAADRDSIPDLNDMPEAIVAEARTLADPSFVRQLLEYYAGLKNRPYLPAFIDDVILGSTSAQRWRRGDVVVPAPSLVDQLRLPREVLLAPIGGYAGVRVVPELARWRSGDGSVGAPARHRPDATYRTGTPQGSIGLVSPELEPAPGIEVAMRRWIAARIARCLRAGQSPTVDGLRASVPAVPEVQAWSVDARAALAALAREARELGPQNTAIPGFRGPDAWFAEGNGGS